MSKMQDRLKLVMDYLLTKDPSKFKTQVAVANYLSYPQSNLSAALKGNEKYLTEGIAKKFCDAFPEISYTWLLNGTGDMIKSNGFIGDYTPKPILKNPMDQLKEIAKRKNNSDGKIVDHDSVIKIKTYIIPMKGFAGLKKALYDDMYISDNFEQTVTDVPREYYAPASYRIQSTGKSMPKTIPENSWVTGVPISEQDWFEYIFKDDKVYILFHPFKGILFKKVKKLSPENIVLQSENEDKIEYPDEQFKITEFRKILLAIKVENFI